MPFYRKNIMAIKTTIGPKGVVSEKVPGTVNEFQITGTQKKNITSLLTGSVSVDKNLTDYVIYDDCDITLPEITADMVGVPYFFYLLDGAGVMSASNAVYSSGSATMAVEFATALSSVTLMPLSSSTYGYAWHAVDGSLNDALNDAKG